MRADLLPVWQDSGKISVSVDAEGNNNSDGGTISVTKPVGATVRKAFLMAASLSGRVIKNGDVILDNTPVSWDQSEFSDIPNRPKFFNNTRADVTSLLKDKLNNAPSGTVTVPVKEIDTLTIDGVILTVIFDDPNRLVERGVILMFGKQSTVGDSFIIRLSSTLNSDTAIAYAGLGISFGFQNTSNPTQYSLIELNGTRLTSSAGGEDDGISANGGLITVGGIDDTAANPPPILPPAEPRTDDELYNLMPFIQPTDKSILFNTINPSNDDNIFFAYFVTSVPSAVLPPLAPPGPRRIYTSDLDTGAGQIDSTKPTVVLTHGLQPGDYEPKDPTTLPNPAMRTDLWTSFAPQKAGALISAQPGADVNIVQYTWKEAFVQDFTVNGDEYISARRNVNDAAANLAKRLFEELGPRYDKPIHFIGHSLGTPVNAYAARDFLNLEPAVTKAQVTILDHPNLIENIPGINPSEADIWGFDENFFATVLPVAKQGLALRIDNYFAEPKVCSTCTGVGTAINGPVYNHGPLINPNDLDDKIFKNESISNDHSGVQQFYRWTIDPNGLYSGVCNSGELNRDRFPDNFDDSLNPCNKGWHWSINGPKSAPDPDKFPGDQGGQPLVKIANLQTLIIENFTDYGCTEVIDGEKTKVRCTEQSSPFGIADINIPENTTYLSFKYLFNNIGDGDYAAVFIDDKPVWVVSGASAIEGVQAEAGPIPVRGLTGQRKLTIALYGVGNKNAEVELSEFKVFGVEVVNNNPPIADAGPDQMVHLGDLVTLDGSESSDPEDDTLTYSWAQTGGPVAFLVGDTIALPTFNAAEVGTYTFTLTVSDGEQTSSDEITVVVNYDFKGFFPPVNNTPIWNTMKAGRAIPVKFSLNDNQGMGIFESNAPTSKDVPCSNNVGVGFPEKTATAGNSGLNYDPVTKTYNYIWKTDRAWAGTCRELRVQLIDGTSHTALFKFTK